MDDIMVRPRYQRYKTHRRKKRYNRNSNDFSQKIALQVLISIIILALAAVIRYVDTPFTNYLEEKTSSIIRQDLEVKRVYEAIDSLLNTSFGKNAGKKADDSEFEEASLPASTQYEPMLEEEYADTGESSSVEDVGSDKERVQDINPGDGKKTSRAGTDNTEEISLPSGLKMAIPVAGPLGSPFGERIHPIKKEETFHRGIDIEANKGAPIKAALAGEVIEAGVEKTLGNYIKVKHTSGFSTVYAHCSVIVSKKGQKVKQGEVIARVGNTGASVGAHLHFELWKDGTAIDPLLFLNIPKKS